MAQGTYVSPRGQMSGCSSQPKGVRCLLESKKQNPTRPPLATVSNKTTSSKFSRWMSSWSGGGGSGGGGSSFSTSEGGQGGGFSSGYLPVLSCRRNPAGPGRGHRVCRAGHPLVMNYKHTHSHTHSPSLYLTHTHSHTGAAGRLRRATTCTMASVTTPLARRAVLNPKP